MLNTTNLIIKEIKQDWRNKLLAVITNPNIAYILMLVEVSMVFSKPGVILPGTVDAICLLLALFSVY